jgi:ribosomal protein S27E
MSKHTYNFIKQQFENEGHNLLSESYKNNKSMLKVKCPKGHTYEVVYNNFQQGSRCPICYGNVKHTYNFIKQQFENEGYVLLSKIYKGSHSKLKVKCPKGHIYNPIYSNFKNNHKCPYCTNNNIKHTYNFIKQQFENEGYKLLSDKYIENKSKLKVKCPEGHRYEVIYNSFQQGKRCPICDFLNKSSKGEKEVLEVVKQYTDEIVIENDRTQIINPKTGYNLELDIWLPELKKAIEYNGEYWHSLEESIEKDKEKSIQCQKKGIDLLIIEEHDWQLNKLLCITNIDKFLKI